MAYPILYSFKRCPYAMRARMALQLAEIKCELREVRLNNKPDHMLEVSPKGTVPILILKDRVIDESIDIVNWTIENSNIFKNKLSSGNISLTEKLIKKFDDKFKFHLDRYKYSSRYEDSDLEFHRTQCLEILIDLEDILPSNGWIFGEELSKLDISILPFIRQYKIAGPNWFELQANIKKTKNLLDKFLNSDLFKAIMYKYDEWELESKPTYFPST